MRQFKRSEEFLIRAEAVIPLGSQTFSKSRAQYPLGVSPLFITRAKGSRAWDLDGNEYIDFVNSLAAVTLGHHDPDVTAAVRTQLEDSGVIFSLPHPLEAEVAEIICDMVPCAEMVRFGKNGSDATAGAVRAARAFTRRDYIAVCGYHGWQDWYIGTTSRNLGVPEATRNLTHSFPYNDLNALASLLDSRRDKFAAIVMEPMGVVEPILGYLEGVKELSHRHGALLIFDETITGFRFANGGAQELFGVTPDIATFGKGIANGYPLSAIAGRRDVMKFFEEIFFSFTMGGETLSLAAAKATLVKLQREPVTARLAATGRRIMEGVDELIDRHKLRRRLSLTGHPSWNFLNINEGEGGSPLEVKTLLMQELFQRGILCCGAHNVCYAHSSSDVAQLLQAYDEALGVVAASLNKGNVRDALLCEPLQPLFKVR